MKTTPTVTAKKSRYYKAIRALALIAFICTVLLTLFILIQSLLPGDASGAQSGFIGDTIQSIIGKDDEELDSATSSFGGFSRFIRKGLGHFLLFGILGIGLTASTFLLIKPRIIYPLLSAVSGLAVAMLSEALQLPIFTSGRSASWTDVGLDVFGVACGIAFASLVLWLYVFIRWIADKNGYSLLKSVFRNAYFRTIMKKCGAVTAIFDDEYHRI